VTGDLRIRVRFDPAEQAELQRVARVAGLPRLAGETGPFPGEDGTPIVSVPPDPGRLDLVLHAVEGRCLLHFTYRGTRRTVHPVSVHARVTGWYLRGREDLGGAVLAEPKLFRLDRMADVEVAEPGTARAPEPEDDRVSIDPITWGVDPPLTAVVAAPAEHVPHASDLLGAPSATRPGPGGTVLLEIPVTHRAAFRSRLYELGVRVRLLGPPDLREEVRAELSAVLQGLPPGAVRRRSAR
jgi:predicted DNA-binding transcriptional regulator YafY